MRTGKGNPAGPRAAHCVVAAWSVALAGGAVLGPGTAAAQVAISPRTVQPAAWERLAVQVVGWSDTAVVGVRVDVPDAVTILGVEPVPGWTSRMTAATDSTPQRIQWTGGALGAREFQEFAFLGRIAGDAREQQLVLPIHLTRAAGEVLHFAGTPGATFPAPRVSIVGSAQMTVRGAVALAGVGIALGIVALGVAIFRGGAQGTGVTATSAASDAMTPQKGAGQ